MQSKKRGKFSLYKAIEKAEKVTKIKFSSKEVSPDLRYFTKSPKFCRDKYKVNPSSKEKKKLSHLARPLHRKNFSESHLKTFAKPRVTSPLNLHPKSKLSVDESHSVFQEEFKQDYNQLLDKIQRLNLENKVAKSKMTRKILRINQKFKKCEKMLPRQRSVSEIYSSLGTFKYSPDYKNYLRK